MSHQAQIDAMKQAVREEEKKAHADRVKAAVNLLHEEGFLFGTSFDVGDINAAVRILVDRGYEVSHPVSLRPEDHAGVSLTEDMSPARPMGSPRFFELIEAMRVTHIAKNAGYSGADNPDHFANFRNATDIGVSAFKSCLVRMGDKWSRIKNLVRDPSNEQVGESVKDTLLDLANYALIAICLYEEECRAAEAQNGVDATVSIDESKLYEEYKIDGVWKGVLRGGSVWPQKK